LAACGYLDWVVTNEFEGYPTFLPHTVSVFYHAGASYVPSIDFWTSSTQGSDLPPLDAVHYDYTVEPASNGPLRPKAADVNGDGRPDLVVGSGNGTFLLLNTGATGVSGSQFKPPWKSTRSFGFVDVADFDNDGVPEIIGMDKSTGNLRVQTFHVVADTLQPLGSTLVAAGIRSLPPCLVLADVPGDGRGHGHDRLPKSAAPNRLPN